MTKRKPSKPPLKKVAQHYAKSSQTFMLELYRRAIVQVQKENEKS